MFGWIKRQAKQLAAVNKVLQIGRIIFGYLRPSIRYLRRAIVFAEEFARLIVKHIPEVKKIIPIGIQKILKQLLDLAKEAVKQGEVLTGADRIWSLLDAVPESDINKLSVDVKEEILALKKSAGKAAKKAEKKVGK